jgi:hypothetical protein
MKIPQWNKRIPKHIQNIGKRIIETLAVGFTENNVTRLQMISSMPARLKFSPGWVVIRLIHTEI